jgi:hypothetical protein
MGEKIKRAAAPDEVIFFTTSDISPQTIFYAGRNVRYAKNKNDAIAFLKATNRTKGVLLSGSNSKGVAQVDVIERISL